MQAAAAEQQLDLMMASLQRQLSNACIKFSQQRVFGAFVIVNAPEVGPSMHQVLAAAHLWRLCDCQCACGGLIIVSKAMVSFFITISNAPEVVVF